MTPSGTAPKRIQPLATELVNQIAAGEVIERPASVVKELVENALDAGATRLLIELEDGGKRLIAITDDGGGIHPDDLRLAVSNHATSKLRSLEELFAISSLGFRGEALASIGSVSQLRLASRQGEAAEGFEIRVEGGEVGEPRAAGLAPGTRVEVGNLFFNVPARRKFLKTSRAEIGAVTQQLSRLALACPQVSITLRHDNKKVLDVPPSDEPRARIAAITTDVIAQEILAVGPREASKITATLRGYISPFSITRGDSRGQYFFVNGRAVRDPLLLSMLRDAYRQLLPPRRHPYAFLWLDIDPADVDVNVHPTKAELRFRQSNQLYAFVLSTLRATLAELAPPSLLSGAIATPSAAPGGEVPPAYQPALEPLITRSFDFGRRGDQPGFGRHGAGHSDLTQGPGSGWAPGNPPGQGLAGGAPPGSYAPGGTAEHASALGPRPPAVERLERARAEGAGTTEALGRALQMHDSFIVEETETGLRIIDQHALHERVLYNDIATRLGRGELETQRLLFPLHIDLDPESLICFSELEPVLEALGFELIFKADQRDLAIHAAPRFLKDREIPETVLDMLRGRNPLFGDDEVTALDRDALRSAAFATPEALGLLHRLSASLACKAAVKFGMPLGPGEIESLLASRVGLDRAYCCPHGRPTTLSLSMNELRRKFGRPAK